MYLLFNISLIGFCIRLIRRIPRWTSGRIVAASGLPFLILMLLYSTPSSASEQGIEVNSGGTSLKNQRMDFYTEYLVEYYKLSGESAASLARWVVNYSREFDVDPTLQLARILTESRGNHWISRGKVKRGRSKEIGLSQIHPSWIGKRPLADYKPDFVITKDMLMDPEGNVRAGVALFKRGMLNFDDDYMMALTWYNNPRASRPNGYSHKVARLCKSIEKKFSEYLQEESSYFSLNSVGE